MYYYETHLHTSPVSQCASAGVRETLEFYKSAGYQGVFITNHFLDGNLKVEARKMPYEEQIKFFFSDIEEGERIGAEIVPAAIENATRNAARNHIENAEFICGDAAHAAKVLYDRGEKPDVIIIDPPRKGCDPSLITTIVAMRPDRVVYVSCDPATLARDLKQFDADGYRITAVTPVDMFPCTAHCEVVVQLRSI